MRNPLNSLEDVQAVAQKVPGSERGFDPRRAHQVLLGFESSLITWPVLNSVQLSEISLRSRLYDLPQVCELGQEFPARSILKANSSKHETRMNKGSNNVGSFKVTKLSAKL